MEKNTSWVIDTLRYPMALLVVFCHAKFLYGLSPGTAEVWNQWLTLRGVQIFFSEVLPHVVVPMFLLFSGLLFFKEGLFDKALYLKKLRSRCRTLLLPYIIWCTVGYIVSAAGGMVEWSPLRWLQGLWDTSLWNTGDRPLIAFWNMPADYPLWFIRDLIICILITPLLFWLLKKSKGWVLLLIGAWWYSHLEAKALIFGSDSLFFFSLGAWFSLSGKDLLQATRRWALPCGIVAVGLMAADFCITYRFFGQLNHLDYNWYVFNAYLITSVIALPHLVAWSIKRFHINKVSVLSGASFFVFATHALLMTPVCDALFRWIDPATQWDYVVFYFIRIIAITGASTLLYLLLHLAAPRVCALLTGGR